MEKALLCVSVGTTAQAADGITAVETALRQATPDCLFARAYTNGGIRRVLAARGQPVDSLPEALVRLKQQGIRQVLVQPTHFCMVQNMKRCAPRCRQQCLNLKCCALAARCWRERRMFRPWQRL